MTQATSKSPLTQQMLTAPPFPLLMRMAGPTAMAFVVQAAVSMAEMMFIAELGTVSLAAIALMFPGLMLMQMLANGAIGGAVSSAIARALGAGDMARAQALIWHALAIAAVAAVVFFVAWHGFGEQVLILLGAEEPIRSVASAYGDVLFGGALLIWSMAMMNSVLRGTGNMQLPAMLMIVGAVLQIPLSGTLVLGWFGMPQLGLRGAAVAVLVVAAVNTGIALFVLQRASSAVRLQFAHLQLRTQLFGSILRVGALSALSPVFTVLSIGMINGLVGGFGTEALAGYGIVARIEFLVVPMVFGLGAAMTAMVGTNIGAGQYQRAERIGWIGGLSAAAVTGSAGVLLALLPGLWVNLFTDNATTLAVGASYLHIVGPVFAFQGLGLSLYFASQGAGNVTWPVVATALRFVISVGGGALCVHAFGTGVEGIFVCLAAGMVFYGTLTAISLKQGAWRR
jgi:putative MATE family efflux protein